MENLLRLAQKCDESGDYELSDKLFKLAQVSTVLPNPIDVAKKVNPYLGYALSPRSKAPQLNAENITKAVNPLLGAALTKENVAQEKKVVDTIAANPFVDVLNYSQEKADQIKEPISAQKKILAIANLTSWFAKSVPAMITQLEAIEDKLDIFSKNPVTNKIFATLDIFNTVKDSVTFLNDVYKIGYNNLYKNDPARVTKYIAKMVQTFTNPQLTKFFPPVIPLQPYLITLNTLSAGMGLMVDAAQGLGNLMGKMENKGSNRIEQVPQAQAYSAQGMKAKAATMPLDQLASKYGEVYNVLLDYVNKKGTVPQLLSKHIPDNDPGKYALVSAHIAQGILPPANGQYQISSGKKARDLAQKQNQQNYVYSPGSGGMGYAIR